jgi:hypothetical protein
MNRFANLFLLELAFLLSPLGGLAQVAPADPGRIDDRGSNSSTGLETPRPVRLTVAPNAHTPVVMATLPKATCALHVEGDITHSVKLFADWEGRVHFYVRPAEESNLAAPFALDCAADGVARSFPLELRPNSFPTEDMPAPPEEAKKVRPGAYVQPALTESEALTLSDEELAMRGYARRPDSRESSTARAAWMQVVTRPMTFIPPRAVEHPERSHDVQFGCPPVCTTPPPVTALTSWNRSGYMLQSNNGNFAGVEGFLTIPAVTVAEPNTQTIASLWVGLDGSGTTDLVQAGSDQINTVFGVWGLTFNVSTYDAWTQFLPQQQFGLVQPDMGVKPGDLVWVRVWMADSYSQTPNLSGQYAFFAFYNVTAGTFTYHQTNKTWVDAKGQTQVTGVLGLQAEWIMERPGIDTSGDLYDLADYGIATLTGAYAQFNNSTSFVPYWSANLVSWSMFRKGTNVLLSYPFHTGSDSMTFHWVGWH